jgi:FHS family L-fucose permease-like MFS transporter
MGALAIAVTLFFFWGFIAASNGIFIPFCKSYFHLSQFASQLVGSAFYGAYFTGSLLLYLASAIIGHDIFNRLGYKRMIVVGLAISSAGALLMIPSAKAESFPALLASFFVVALGFSVQQTATQPFIIALGPPETGAHRLSLGGSINSVGTILGPIIISYVLFGTPTSAAATVTVRSISTLYLVVATIFAGVALFFHFAKIPEERVESDFVRAPHMSTTLLVLTGFIIAAIIAGELTTIDKLTLTAATVIAIIGSFLVAYAKANKNPDGWGAMRYPQVVLGAIGIFVYVGVEVTIDNNFGALLRTPGYLTADGLADNAISKYVTLYWGSIMIGRWTGALGVFTMTRLTRIFATIITPFVAFVVVLVTNRFYGNDVRDLYAFAACVAIAVITFFASGVRPVRMLLMVTSLATVCTLTGVMTSGLFSVYCFMAAGLFVSVMWPAVFALALAGVGRVSGQASALLIMMILGGAIIPPLQGSIGDATSMHASYAVAIACFVVLFTIGIEQRRVLARQGIDLDATAAQH